MFNFVFQIHLYYYKNCAKLNFLGRKSTKIQKKVIEYGKKYLLTLFSQYE